MAVEQSESFKEENSLTAQGRSWAPLTPSDDNNLEFVPKAVHCASATGGAFTAIGADGEEAPFYINPGQMLEIRPKRIKASGMTGGLVLTGLRT